MALDEFLTELATLQSEALAALAAAADASALETARVEFLGAKSGRLKGAKQLGTVDGSHKPAADKLLVEASCSM